MKTPDVIYLIDGGDEVTWCDDQNPSGEIDPEDTVMYLKATPMALAAQDMLEALINAKSFIEAYADDTEAPRLINELDAAIKKAKGEI
jgi:hypothetical protein